MTFIVRIYHFTGDGPEDMVGIVETVTNGEEKQFTGIQERGKLLVNAGRRSKRR